MNNEGTKSPAGTRAPKVTTVWQKRMAAATNKSQRMQIARRGYPTLDAVEAALRKLEADPAYTVTRGVEIRFAWPPHFVFAEWTAQQAPVWKWSRELLAAFMVRWSHLRCADRARRLQAIHRRALAGSGHDRERERHTFDS